MAQRGRAQIAPMPCPKCGGQMYDNIADKAAGRRPAKAPDYACKDRQGCDHGIWLKDSEKNALQGVGRTGAAKGPAKPLVLDKALDMCFTAAGNVLNAQLGKLGEHATPVDHADRAAYLVQTAIAMFTARTAGKPACILKAELASLAEQQKRAREAEERRRAAEEAEAARRRQDEDAQGGDYPGPYDDLGGLGDDDLPF